VWAIICFAETAAALSHKEEGLHARLSTTTERLVDAIDSGDEKYPEGWD
jgi:hypothetical protein